MNGTFLNVGLFFVDFPYLSVQNTLRDGAYIRISRSLDVYCKKEVVPVRQLSVCFLHRIVKIGRMSHIHAGRFNQSNVVDSFRCSFR